MSSGSSSFYYHYDAIGSVANLISSNGATQWTYDYEPYGTPRNVTQNDPSAPANPMQYTGEYSDPTALTYLRARQYDPTTGRMLSVDPVAPAIGAAVGSAYAYANNQPTVMVDPSGKTFLPYVGGRALALSVASFAPELPQTVLGGSSSETTSSRILQHASSSAQANVDNAVCGPGGSVVNRILNWLVPDTFLGISFRPSCQFHDVCYGTWGTIRLSCDNGFYVRLIRTCYTDGSFDDAVFSACGEVAQLMYKGVRKFGNRSFIPNQEAICPRSDKAWCKRDVLARSA